MAAHQTHNHSQPQRNGSEPNGNFDQWAKAVKQQMIAALKRRGSEAE